jgi:hypothetical protein
MCLSCTYISVIFRAVYRCVLTLLIDYYKPKMAGLNARARLGSSTYLYFIYRFPYYCPHPAITVTLAHLHTLSIPTSTSTTAFPAHLIKHHKGQKTAQCTQECAALLSEYKAQLSTKEKNDAMHSSVCCVVIKTLRQGSPQKKKDDTAHPWVCCVVIII